MCMVYPIYEYVFWFVAIRDIIRDVSFFLCVGGSNFPPEVVSKKFFSPCRIHLKFPPPHPEDEGYSVVSLIGYAVTVGHCLA